VAEEGISGAADEILASRCREEDRILVTLDLDLANLLAYPPATTPGIIVLRSKRQDKVTVLNLFAKLVRMLELRAPEQQLWIVEADRIRTREG
jgi:predicted nuclease of predicted toxin-antitoxin system